MKKICMSFILLYVNQVFGVFFANVEKAMWQAEAKDLMQSYSIQPVTFKTGQAPDFGSVFGMSITEVEFDLNEQFQIENLALTLSNKNGSKPNRMYLLAVVNKALPAAFSQMVNSKLSNALAAFGKNVWSEGVYLFPFLVFNGKIVTNFSQPGAPQVYVAMYDSAQKPVGIYLVSSTQSGPSSQSSFQMISDTIGTLGKANWTTAQSPDFLIREAQVVVNDKVTLFPFGNILKIVGKAK